MLLVHAHERTAVNSSVIVHCPTIIPLGSPIGHCMQQLQFNCKRTLSGRGGGGQGNAQLSAQTGLQNFAAATLQTMNAPAAAQITIPSRRSWTTGTLAFFYVLILASARTHSGHWSIACMQHSLLPDQNPGGLGLP